MTLPGLPVEVRDRLPDHRRSVGTEPQSGLPEFWIVGKCSGCGNEWARQGEGQTWNATCECGGDIRPRRGNRPGAECVPDAEASWGASEALVAFRMPETVSVSIISNWSGTGRKLREFDAHDKAGWPIYGTPPRDEESFMQWMRDEFRYGPPMRPCQIAPDAVDDYAEMRGVKISERDGVTVLTTPFGKLVVTDCDPAVWVKRQQAAQASG